jgi:hypothetical protein
MNDNAGHDKPSGTPDGKKPTPWKIPGILTSDLGRIMLLFLVSRFFLTVVGVVSVKLLGRQIGRRMEWVHPPYAWLDIWGQWDTGWYLDIAQNWYSLTTPYRHYSNYAFFPLYPTLMRLLGGVLGSHYYAGLIISNAALIGAAVLLYRLVLLDHDREVALGSVKYLFIWPTSFILSGVLSESLYLVLVLGCFYLARQGRWIRVGITGFFLSLTRVIGVCVGLPLFYEYMKEKRFRVKNIRMDILTLALLPLGLLVFCIYNYALTGDFLAFVHIQSAWGRHYVDPFNILVIGMLGGVKGSGGIVAAWFTGLTLLALAVFYRRVPLSHMLFCLISIFIPLTSGLMSMPRFLVVLFPLFILFAQLGKNRIADAAFTLILIVLQACFMVFWSTGSPLIV